MGVMFYGSINKCQSGDKTVSTGDMNGDGFPDFAIGEPLVPPFYTGAVRVIFGCSSNCYGAIMKLNNMGSRGFSIVGPGQAALIGAAMSAAGDINGDGYDDLILGSMMMFNQQGAVYVIYGKRVPTDVDLAALSLSQGYMIRSVKMSQFGMSVAGGVDFNHDGMPDFVVGNPASPIKNKAVAILGGRRFTTLADMTTRDGFYMSSSSRDGAGKEVSAVGDFNGDGFVDYAVGAYEDSTGGKNSGVVCIIYDIYATDNNVTLTHSPVLSPTAYPTHNPTLSPTSLPTYDPTAAPTKAPSATFYPSCSPSSLPTAQPSVNPSNAPISDPTSTPSSSPTPSPPSNFPSSMPTEAPNLTSQPTSPTLAPTQLPTRNPSAFPTFTPSNSPSPAPTLRPTRLPTASPTIAPTIHPSPQPSMHPTLLPTNLPTQSQSLTPTPISGFGPIHLTQCASYVGSPASELFIIDVAEGCVMRIDGGEGDADIFRFSPSPRSHITIDNFNLELDIIDLSMLSVLRNWRDVNITGESVLIQLPEDMTVLVSNYSSHNMTAGHFVFHKQTTDETTDNAFTAANISIVITFSFSAIMILCLVLASAPSWKSRMPNVQNKMTQKHKTPRRESTQLDSEFQLTTIDEEGQYVLGESDGDEEECIVDMFSISSDSYSNSDDGYPISSGEDDIMDMLSISSSYDNEESDVYTISDGSSCDV